jgi:hypothetical protein
MSRCVEKSAVHLRPESPFTFAGMRSQLPIEHWHEYLREATLADAILARLLQGAHRIALRGESMRRTKAKTLTDRDRSA